MTEPIRKKELDQSAPGFECYHDGKSWLIEDDYKVWRKCEEKQIRRELAFVGLRSAKGPEENLSPVDEFLRQRPHSHSVDYAGPLAGWDSGMHDICSHRVLVTRGVKMLEAKPGDWSTLRQISEGLLNYDQYRQTDYLYSWASIALKALRAREKMPGQALAFVGPAECGKSLMQKIITKMLGGRAASPFRYMDKGTEFNKELIGSEHLAIEDQAGKMGHQERRLMGEYLKQFAANEEHSCHPKGIDAFTLTPFWRVTLSLNDCGENILALPPLDANLRDKLIILKCQKRDMPMQTNGYKERKNFGELIDAEIPAFMHFLEQEWRIPEEIEGGRFGFRAFQHPDIVEALSGGSSETQLLALIDLHRFAREKEREWADWEVKASEVEAALFHDPLVSRQASKLLVWTNACGTLLGKLAASEVPEKRVEHGRSYTRTKLWKIHPPQS